jgi:hypothetical protein
MPDVFVAQVGLQSAGVVTLVREGVAAGMAKHVRVNAKLEFGLGAQSGHHLGEARGGERRTTLRCEYER